MADKRKHDDKPKDPKSTDQTPLHSMPDLELPKDSGPESGVEPIEVVEVVEDEEVLEVDEALAESGESGIMDVAEAASESGESEIIEVAEAASESGESGIIDVAEAASESGESGIIEAVEAVEEDSKSGHLVDHADEEIEIDDSDAVEVLPSSHNVIDAPLVEEAEAEVVEAGEAVSDIAKKHPEEPHEVRAEDAVAEEDSSSSAGMAGRRSTWTKKQAARAIVRREWTSLPRLWNRESIRPSQPATQPEAKAKTGSDSDIDLESILDDSAESSAVDLGAPGKRSLPDSETPKSGEGVDKLVGVEDAEGAEVIDESLLLDSAEAESAALAEDGDAVLVTPKRRTRLGRGGGSSIRRSEQGRRRRGGCGGCGG